MSDQTRHRFITAELDTGLLSGMIRTQTNWYVITGAPCCGKTTLIDRLAARGYETVPEPGRQYIQQELARGRSIEQIRSDASVFQRQLLIFNLEIERNLPPRRLLFLDRALPDFITFHRANGMDPNEVMPICIKNQYASVFILDRFPVQLDEARIEDEQTSDFVDQWLERDYRTLGYRVARVPILPVDERVEYILARLQPA